MDTAGGDTGMEGTHTTGVTAGPLQSWGAPQSRGPPCLPRAGVPPHPAHRNSSSTMLLRVTQTRGGSFRNSRGESCPLSWGARGGQGPPQHSPQAGEELSWGGTGGSGTPLPLPTDPHSREELSTGLGQHRGDRDPRTPNTLQNLPTAPKRQGRAELGGTGGSGAPEDPKTPHSRGELPLSWGCAARVPHRPPQPLSS